MAKSVKALITPEVLKWVREKRIRLTIDYAAKKLKVEPERLAAWENGGERPSIAQLKKIAKLYKTHISLFYLPSSPTDFQPLTDYRILSDSAAPDEKEVYRLNANIVEAYERRYTLLELYELLAESPPQVTLKVSRQEGPKRAAQKITEFLEFNREQLQQANTPYDALKFWKRIVEAKGILVCQTSVNTHLSVELTTVRGFCIAETPCPVIVINPKDSPYGRIFTIIHELVHVALGESVIQNTGFEKASSSNLEPIEIFCNEVAAEVLVPRNELLEMVTSRAIEEELPKISKHFHVSSEVIMRRLLTLKKISDEKYKTYRNSQLEKYKGTRGKSGGPVLYHNRLLNTYGEHFARTAFTAYHEDKITLSELSSAFSNCATKHLRAIDNQIFS